MDFAQVPHENTCLVVQFVCKFIVAMFALGIHRIDFSNLLKMRPNGSLQILALDLSLLRLLALWRRLGPFGANLGRWNLLSVIIEELIVKA